MARKVIPIATETHGDGTTITYCFEKSSGVFWSNISGFATGQNDGNRWIKLKFNTIEDLQADLKGKNVKWEDDAKTLFPELQENKMKKLTTEQKAKVVKFAKSLINKKSINENNSTLKMNLSADQEFANIGKFLKGAGIKYSWSAEQGTLIFNNSLDRKNAAVLLRQSEFSNLMAESKKPLKESANTYTMVSALREITDDLLLQTEMMIDNQYGKADHKQFKALWYKTANEFEKKFGTIIKSLMKAGK